MRRNLVDIALREPARTPRFKQARIWRFSANQARRHTGALSPRSVYADHVPLRMHLYRAILSLLLS